MDCHARALKCRGGAVHAAHAKSRNENGAIPLTAPRPPGSIQGSRQLFLLRMACIKKERATDVSWTACKVEYRPFGTANSSRRMFHALQTNGKKARFWEGPAVGWHVRARKKNRARKAGNGALITWRHRIFERRFARKRRKQNRTRNKKLTGNRNYQTNGVKK